MLSINIDFSNISDDINLYYLYDLGYIDLSKRRVSAEEVKKCEEKFTRGKTVGNG